MTRGPGFVDEISGTSLDSVGAADSAPTPTPPPQGPRLFDVEYGTIETSGGKIANDWDLRPVAQVSSGLSSIGWMALGTSVLVGGWVCLSLVGFVLAQFRQSAWLGAVTLLLFTLGFALIGIGIAREILAWRSLRHVEMLRESLRRTDIPPDKLRTEVLPWLNDVRRYVPAVDTVTATIMSAGTSIEIVSILRSQVIEPLRQAVVRAGTQAALVGGTLVAVIPSPGIESAIVGLRCLILVRQVARIYGIRPSLPVIVHLLHRTALTVVVVATTDVLSRVVAETILHKFPAAEHIFAALPETSVAALRLYRLATVVSAACSPIGDEIRSVS